MELRLCALPRRARGDGAHAEYARGECGRGALGAGQRLAGSAGPTRGVSPPPPASVQPTPAPRRGESRRAPALGRQPLLLTDRLTTFATHYPWIDPAGLQYFRDRLRQAPRDAAYAFGLVLDRATTRPAQDQALAALAFKCDVLWALLDAVQAGPLPWMPA